MFGVGPMELLLLACVGLPMLLATIVVLLAAIRYLSKPAQPRAPLAAQPFASPALSHQDVLRTRYFVNPGSASRTCPRCRSALPADAPEGLCPACLLAGGLEEAALPPTSSGHGTPAGAPAIDAAQLSAAFPHLEILELLGQGGMGTVLKVRQKNLDRLAALKVIPPQAALDPSFAERFGREARALARLNHASIVTVYESGQAGGFYFLLMEYIDGPNLRQLMRSERIAPREALAIVPQICDALQYAHDQGIVHRDIKPENVLLDRTGRVKIADFGLAKLLGNSPADFTLTHTQQVMGTPRYMAPEQIEHPLEVDHRADIYSLGVVIYEMLTGELPIGRFAPPSQKAAVDVRLDEIVLRTLEKEPARRYQQASEVRTELESVGHSAPPRPAPASMAAAQHRAIEQALTLRQQAAAPPLGIVLAVAIGMVLGMLMIGAGLALMAFPFFASSSWNLDPWPFLGAGVGTLIGGAGSFLGSYNTYRQLAGAVDLMSSPDITWFDYVLLAYGALGILTMIPGIQGLLLDPDEEHVYPMLLIGGIVSFQSLLGILWRWGARNLRTAEQKPVPAAAFGKPEIAGDRELALAQVRGPGMGLIVSGVLGFAPPVLLCVAIPISWAVLLPVKTDKVTPGPVIIREEVSAVAAYPLPVASVGILQPPVLLAQSSSAPSAMPTWGVLFIFLVGLVLVLSFPASILLILGGMKMRQLRSYGLANLAAVVALLPLGPQWLISLPMGIWALAVLGRPEVKGAFE